MFVLIIRYVSFMCLNVIPPVAMQPRILEFMLTSFLCVIDFCPL